MRYFTDFIDAEGLSRDEDGLDFTDRQEACFAASEAVIEAAHDILRGRPRGAAQGGSLCLEAQVRDAGGTVVFRARLTLDAEWLVPDG